MARTILSRELSLSKPLGSAEQEGFINLLRTADQLTAELSSLLRQHALSPPQYNVLRILRGAGPDGLPCAGIAQRMITRVPDITRLLDRLEGSGLIGRERSGRDRRVVMVRISPRGLKLLRRLDQPLLELHTAQFTRLAPRDLDRLNRLLEKARQRGPERRRPR